MFRTLLALSVALSCVAEAKDTTVHKRFDRRFGTANWSVFAQRMRSTGDRLVAINRETMQVEVIDPVKGETITQDKLDTRARFATTVETLGLSTGEFAIAFATALGHVELHSLDGEVSFEIEAGQRDERRMEQSAEFLNVKSISLAERRRGELFMAVITKGSAEVYHRTANSLILVQRVSTRSGIQSGKLMIASEGELLLQAFDGSGKLHLLHIDPAQKSSEELIAIPHTGARRADGILSEGTDYIAAQMDGKGVRFYMDRNRKTTQAVPADLNLGTNEWMRDSNGLWLFSAVHRENEKSATRLTLYNPYELKKSVRLGVEGARVITDVGTIGYANAPLYYFVKDHKTVVVQNDSVLNTISSKEKEGERVTLVQPVRGARGERALAVTFEGTNGSRLLVIGLK